MPDEQDPLDAALDELPPASESQGQGGHDSLDQVARAAALLRDKAFGYTYDELATKYGYSDRSGARRAIIRALEARVSESASLLRDIENERYERDQRALRLIIGGQNVEPALRIRAIDARTRSAARNARMNGLDAPVKVEVSASVRQELQAALDELAASYGIVQGEVTDVHDEPYTDELREG